jgi:hypothetical protein
MYKSTINTDSQSPYFKTIWSIGSTSSGASTFNGSLHPDVTLPCSTCSCNPLYIGTDQTNVKQNIQDGMKYLAQFGPVLLVNSIGYAIDGGKSTDPGPFMLEVTSEGFSNTHLVSIFAEIVRENPELENMFWVFNRNYSHPHGKVGGQWANVGYQLLGLMDIPDYEKYEYIADVGGGSVTFYYREGPDFQEYKNIHMFMNKKNNESPNQCYLEDPTGKKFVEIFTKSLESQSQITKDNLLVLQTGKMREDNALVPDFPFDHYYLDHRFEVMGEAMDIVNSLTQSNQVYSMTLSQSDRENVVNVTIYNPTYYEMFLTMAQNMFHHLTFGYFV